MRKIAGWAVALLLPLTAAAQDYEALLRGAQGCAVSIYLAPRGVAAAADAPKRAPLEPVADMKQWLERRAPSGGRMPLSAPGLGLLWQDARHVLSSLAVLGSEEDGDLQPVVEDASGRRQLAERLGHDALSGAVLLRLPEPARAGSPCAWGSASGLRLGQELVAVGHLAQLRWSLQRGHVSALRRQVPGAGLIEHYVETSARSGPGMAGGPLLDLQGRVVGMHEAVFGDASMPNLVALALPIEPLLAAAEQLHSGRPPVRARLGLRLLADERARDLQALMQPPAGVLVEAVDAGSPAAQAGLRAGDRLLALNGRRLDGRDAWARASARLPRGQLASLLLQRDGREFELRLQPEPPP